jgi:chitodextrinase
MKYVIYALRMRTFSMVVLGLFFALGLSACSGGGSPSLGAQTPDTNAPSAPSGLLVTAVTTDSVSLSWNAAIDDVAVAGYSIFRNGIQVGISQTKSFTDSALASDTTYTYSVSACDAAGNNSAQSAIVIATTLVIAIGDISPPRAPANLVATAVSSSQINLTWSASTDDVGVTGYEVWQGATLVATVTGTSYNDSGLTAGKLYVYTVKAYDDAGNISAASAPAAAQTIPEVPADTTPPSTPTDLIATALSESSIMLYWDQSTDNVGVTGYEIWLNTASIATVTTNVYTATRLASDTTYTYSVKAFDTAGNVSASSAPASASTFASVSPQMLVLSAVTATAGDTITITINPGSVSVVGTLNVYPWYLFPETGVPGASPIATPEVCTNVWCTALTSVPFTVPSSWTSGSYYFCVINPLFTCQRLEVTNNTVIIDRGTCTLVSSQGPSDQKLDLVFVADNFSADNMDLFRSKINEYIAALLSVTPFAENSAKFNVWKIERLGSMQPDVTAGDLPVPVLWNNMVSRCRGADVVAVIEGPACSLVTGIAGGDPTPWLILHETYAGDAFVHEFGHALAGLGDEYSNTRYYLMDPGPSLRSNTDVAFCPKWCSGEPNTLSSLPIEGFSCWTAWQTFTSCIQQAGEAPSGDAVEACWWQAADLHNGWVAGIEMCDFGINCRTSTGCFWNARATNLFRSTAQSIMSGADLSTGFNPPSLDALRQKLDLYQ